MIQVAAKRKREGSTMMNGGAIGARPDPKARPCPKPKIALGPGPRSKALKRKAVLMAASEEIVPFQQEEARDASEDKDKAEIVPFEDDTVMQNVRDVFDDLLNC